ncbi:MAG: S-(hydroxymethyl)glutathione synthase [Myxococcaceae bacterium]|nr:S-(hydroxymethyl)glutathione synthase [Myxococcaceae bacterium]
MGHRIDKPWRHCAGRTHRGGCECGAVRYELKIDPCADDIALSASELLIRAREFTLLAGEDALSGHQLASFRVHHFYCEHCGVCSFERHNIEQRGAEFYAVDVRRLDVPRACWGVSD